MVCSRIAHLVFISLPFVILLSGKKSDGVRQTDHATQRRPLSVLLVTAPYAGHLLPCLALGEELAKRGHNVTLVSAPTDFIRKEIGKYGITLWSIGEGFISPEKHRELFYNTKGRKSEFSAGLASIEVSADFEKRVLKNIDNTAIKSFDIVVGDKDFFVNLMRFSLKWNIPGVYLSPSFSNNLFDIQPWPFPVYNTGYTDNLNFLQRLLVTIIKKILQIILRVIFAIYSLDIPYYPHYHPQIICSSIGFQFPHALLPLTNYVGPLISSIQPQLPQHIEEWLSGRDPKSVVYVSMGTTAILTSAQAEMIVNGATRANLSVVWSLRKTNQHILEHMTYDHEKVMISDWLPQVTILRHPSIHSAVLHGGLGGIQEALSCGVPIVVIPFLFDQRDNGVRVKHYNYGEMIKLHELSTPLVTHTLQVIGTELYRNSSKKIQRIYKNDGGATRAADLIEFYSDVGYEHLIPSYAKYNWTWIEFHNIDVHFVLAAAALLLSYLLYRVTLCCRNSIFHLKRKLKSE